jgi:putative mRNA 3-end processing factor
LGVPHPLVTQTDRGLYCPPGDFYIDPWRPVPRAVITHAHGDHARSGSEHYLCAEPGRGILQNRLGPEATIDALPYDRPSTTASVFRFTPPGTSSALPRCAWNTRATCGS